MVATPVTKHLPPPPYAHTHKKTTPRTTPRLRDALFDDINQSKCLPHPSSGSIPPRSRRRSRGERWSGRRRRRATRARCFRSCPLAFALASHPPRERGAPRGGGAGRAAPLQQSAPNPYLPLCPFPTYLQVIGAGRRLGHLCPIRSPAHKPRPRPGLLESPPPPISPELDRIQLKKTHFVRPPHTTVASHLCMRSPTPTYRRHPLPPKEIPRKPGAAAPSEGLSPSFYLPRLPCLAGWTHNCLSCVRMHACMRLPVCILYAWRRLSIAQHHVYLYPPPSPSPPATSPTHPLTPHSPLSSSLLFPSRKEPLNTFPLSSPLSPLLPQSPLLAPVGEMIKFHPARGWVPGSVQPRALPSVA